MTRRSRQLAAIAILLACVLATLGIAGFALAHRAASASSPSDVTWFTGTRWQSEPKVSWETNFTLPDQNRRPVTLRQFRGKVVLLSFTSSVCKSQCPLVGRELSLSEGFLGSLARRTVILNVSVEPETDTRRTVYRFAREVGWLPYNWHYVWASREQMKPIWAAYYVYVQAPPRNPKPNQDVKHLAAMAMIDPEGRIRAYFAYPFLPHQIAAGVRHLLQVPS